jgi:hypothetical protein
MENKIVKIYVSRIANSNRLRLRDEVSNPGNSKLTTAVNPGDKVQWELDPLSLGPNPEPGYSPIAFILDIRISTPEDGDQYRNSVAVLEADPVPGPGGVFEATVKSPSPGKGKEEDYMITYMLPGSKYMYQEDPKLQMNT